MIRLADLTDVMSDVETNLVDTVLELPTKLAQLLPDGPMRSKVIAECDMACRQILRSHADQIRLHFDRLGRAK